MDSVDIEAGGWESVDEIGLSGCTELYVVSKVGIMRLFGGDDTISGSGCGRPTMNDRKSRTPIDSVVTSVFCDVALDTEASYCGS